MKHKALAVVALATAACLFVLFSRTSTIWKQLPAEVADLTSLDRDAERFPGADIQLRPGQGLLAGPFGSTQTSFAANVVTEAGFLGNGIHEEPNIAVNPRDPNHLVAIANVDLVYAEGSALVFRAMPIYRTSFDRGRTWTNGFPNLWGFDYASDPSVAFDTQGNVYICMLVGHLSQVGFFAVNQSIAVFKSTDGGQHFDEFSLVDSGSGANATRSVDDKPWLTIDTSPTSPYKDRLYVCWQQSDRRADERLQPLAVMISSSSNGGRTWSQPQRLSTVDGASFTTSPATGPDGTVYVSFARFSEAPLRDDYLITRSYNGGSTWSDPVIIVDIAVGDVFPTNSVGRPTLSDVHYRVHTSTSRQLIAAPDGTLYFVWFDHRNGTVNATNTDIFLSVSYDNGARWGTPVNVDTSAGDQFWPSIDIAPNGRLQIAYYDDGYDPDKIKLGVTLARSVNGVNWTRTAVHTGLSDPRLVRWYLVPANNPNGQTVFIGDYLGLAVDTLGRAHVVWADFRRDVDAAFQIPLKVKGENIVYACVDP